MSDRKHLYKQVSLALLLVVSGSVSQAGGREYQGCSTGSLNSADPQVQSHVCSGNNRYEPANAWKDFSMFGQVSCQCCGFYSQNFSGSARVTANGQCGGATEGTLPICDGIVGQASDQGWTPSSYSWEVQVSHNVATETSCSPATPTYVTISLPVEGCCDAACQSNGHYEACVHNNGLLSGCVCGISPIVISLDGHKPLLTSPEEGVQFDLAPDGKPEQVSWTRADRNDGFLVLDRNGNGTIDNSKEMFGSTTDQPPINGRNGFNALTVFDANRDERIDDEDPIYERLRLWIDRNHNGQSERQELQSLAAAGLLSISLEYRELPLQDRNGNLFKYVARVRLRDGRAVLTRLAYDIFLVGR